MIRFELENTDVEAIKAGYPKKRPVALANDQNFASLTDYFIMLEYHYVQYRQSNNIDNWLGNIDKQIYLRDNEEYFGDNVCVFFKDDTVKIINYWDYKAGKDLYCELPVEKLKQLTIEWKWFVVDWEVKLIKGEL